MMHTFTLTVDIDPDWVEYLTVYPYIFAQTSAGYWLHGAALDEKLGWLVYEERFDGYRTTTADLEAIALKWRAGEPLPPRWYRLDRAAALRAWEEGVKRWGINWYDDVDGTREDVVVQLALLGEIRYG